MPEPDELAQVSHLAEGVAELIKDLHHFSTAILWDCLVDEVVCFEYRPLSYQIKSLVCSQLWNPEKALKFHNINTRLSKIVQDTGNSTHDWRFGKLQPFAGLRVELQEEFARRHIPQAEPTAQPMTLDEHCTKYLLWWDNEFVD